MKTLEKRIDKGLHKWGGAIQIGDIADGLDLIAKTLELKSNQSDSDTRIFTFSTVIAILHLASWMLNELAGYTK